MTGHEKRKQQLAILEMQDRLAQADREMRLAKKMFAKGMDRVGIRMIMASVNAKLGIQSHSHRARRERRPLV